MNENMKVMDARGIPTMKALWLGIIIDGDDPPNRHLELAGLWGKEIFLELGEVSYDLEDGSEEVEDSPINYMPMDPDDEEVEECDRFPKGCKACPDEECNGPDSELPDEDETFIELFVAYREKPDGEWIEFSELEVAGNPALCRFLNTINDTHGL